MANLHGKPVAHHALLGTDGEQGYESPEEYADQGDERVIRDLMFGYTVENEDAAGNPILSTTEAMRNDTVTIEQIGLIALKKGEDNHSFYTTAELDRLQGASPEAAELPDGDYADWTDADLSEAGEFELAEWLKGSGATINDVLEKVGDDKDLAHRMLQAENIATEGDPRKGLEQGLTRIIQGD